MDFWTTKDYEQIKHLSLKDQEFLKDFSIEVMLRLYMPGQDQVVYDRIVRELNRIALGHANRKLRERDVIITYKT